MKNDLLWKNTSNIKNMNMTKHKLNKEVGGGVHITCANKYVIAYATKDNIAHVFAYIITYVITCIVAYVIKHVMAQGITFVVAYHIT